MRNQLQWMNIDSLKIDDDFEGLYSRKEKLIETITKDMHQNGYDEAWPIICWEREEEDGHKSLIVIDGHTRLLAAKKAGHQEVSVSVLDFPDKDTALLHAIHCQRDRRNMSDADIYICAGVVDKRKPRGGDRRSESVKSKSSTEPIETKSSAQETADIIGTSDTKVKKVRFIRANADEQLKRDVREGKKTINSAYNEILKKQKTIDNHEGQGKPNGAQVDNDLSQTFQVMMEKLLAMVKQAKEGGWQKLDKQVVFSGMTELGKLLKE